MPGCGDSKQTLVLMTLTSRARFSEEVEMEERVTLSLYNCSSLKVSSLKDAISLSIPINLFKTEANVMFMSHNILPRPTSP